jgi:hypothetical protein
MPIATKNVHLSKLFTVSKSIKTLSCEASDLSARTTHKQPFDIMEGGPVGLFIMSEKTNEVAEFVIVGREDREGDIMFWTLAPNDKTLASFPQLRGWVVTVFND